MATKSSFKRRRTSAPKVSVLGHEPSVPSDEVGTDEGFAALEALGALIPTSGVGPEALREQLSVINDLLAAKTSFVLEHAASRRQLRVACVRGRHDPRVKAVEPADGPMGRAFSERRVVVEPGLWAAPLLGADGPLGALVVLGARRRSDAALAKALAAQIAAAWEFARLKDDTARRNKDLQTAVAGLRALERAREEHLSHVSHELKNPLTTVKAYLSLMSREKTGPLSAEQQKAVAVCERNSDRLLRMINDLLLMSRLQSGKMQLGNRPFGLKSLADDVVRALAPAATVSKVKLQLHRGGEAFIRGDRERLGEAIYNLVDHALQSARAGGTVGVKVRSNGHGLVSLSVQDDGPAIPAEDLPHLFDAYPPRRQGAITLPIVAKIVHLHGGRVEAQTHPEEGTTYTLLLPVFAGAVTDLSMNDTSPRAGGILLVEDDADCRDVLKDVLEQEGYPVVAASSAAEAKTALGQLRPALVLLDLRLRDDDGRTVLHLVRTTKALEDVAVYIISGASDVASLTAGQGPDRIDGYFEKPLQLSRLLDTVASVVRPAAQ